MRIITGDCLDVLADMEPESLDACVTDPPYHLTNRTPDVKWCADCNRVLGGNDGKPAVCPRCGGRLEYQRSQGGRGFMGQTWDGGDIAFRPETWAAVLRVLKPGSHLLAFGGTRTYHRMVCAIEDAGFEIRDQIGWAYGSGFPKSLDVSKAIDKAAGAEREVVGRKTGRAATPVQNIRGGSFAGGNGVNGGADCSAITAPATPEAAAWQGWGTALKPAHEPVCWAQKPYEPQQVLAILAPTIGELICKVALCAKTDMRLCALVQTGGCLSTAISLNNCLADLYERMSTFTTETASALITDLKILKCSLLRITQSTTTEEPNRTSGDESDALLVAAISRSVLAKCEKLALTTAGEIAIDWLALEGSGPEVSNLTPLWEPIVVARKPLVGTVAANVLAYGTGAINIDGCRVEGEPWKAHRATGLASDKFFTRGEAVEIDKVPHDLGRWPANLIHDGSDEVLACFHDSKGQQGDVRGTEPSRTGGEGTSCYGEYGRIPAAKRGDSGSAARFFKSCAWGDDDWAVEDSDPVQGMRFLYCPKASRSERGEGNTHPTVKPLALMRYLCRLVTPPGGTVLDPFAGSGTTGIAAQCEGFDAVLIERDPTYAEIARKRVHAPLFAGAAE